MSPRLQQILVIGIVAVTPLVIGLAALIILPFSSQRFTIAYIFITLVIYGTVMRYVIPRYWDKLFHPEAVRWNDRGVKKLRQGDYEGAMTDFDQALRLYPGFALPHINRGVTHRIQKQYPEALDDFMNAIELDQRRWLPTAYLRRAEVYRDQKVFPKALADCNRAIQIDPKYTDAYFTRSAIWYEQGEYDNIIADCDTIIQFSVSRKISAQAYSNRALVYIQKGELDKSILNCDEAIKLRPKLPQPYIVRGLTKFLVTQYTAALEDFNKAAQLEPNDEATIAGQAVCKQALGELNAANALWKTLVERDAQFNDIEWVKNHFRWTNPTLLEAARQLIADVAITEPGKAVAEE